MSKILGLDLGTNSIGWAVVDDENNEILGTGVRIFQEGVVEKGTAKEMSKNATRRDARQARRQNFRTAMRKKIVKRELRKYGMCPVNNDNLKEWFKLNPYELRAKAIYEKIELLELGRIFYHLAQHRGFKSNRIAGAKDTTLDKGKKESGTIGITETKSKIQEVQTLGNYLYSISYKDGEKYNTHFDENGKELRVRNRYTTREMYEEEFEKIWNEQKQYYPSILTDELFIKLGYNNESGKDDGIIFYQRPLRSQKSLLAKCTFENHPFFDKKENKWITIGKTPCPISHPIFEERRAWEFINTIEYNEKQKLSPQQKQIVINLINSKDKRFDFSEIKKVLSMPDAKFNYEDNHKVAGNYTIKNLSNLFDKEIWNNEQKRNEIWHCFYSYADNNKLIEKLIKSYGLKENDKKKVENIHLKQGYSNLSLKAINNILPFLKKGYLFNDAVLLGGVKNAFGERWEYFKEFHSEIEDNIISIASGKNKEGEVIENIKEYLFTEYKIEEKQLKKLYHHSQETEKQEIKTKLDTPKNIRNPIVQQALYELKKVVNAVIEKYGKPDEIKVELARDLKQSKDRRLQQWYENRDRENENDEARAKLDEFGLAHSRDNIQKFLLYKEIENQNGIVICPYTGNTIKLTDLFGRDNKFQIEHIIPYSVSLDDSFSNKTLCDSKENQEKGELTPYQFYIKQGIDKWKLVSERAFKLLPYNKAKRFTSKTSHETDFISRQLNDTRYISKEAKNYMKTICEKVTVLPGSLTAELRHKWGLNSILNPGKEVNTPLKKGKYWAKIDENKNIDYYPIYNKKPDRFDDEIIIDGEVKKGEFESKFLCVKIPVDELNDGKYWAKIGIEEKPEKYVTVFNKKPDSTENEITISGTIIIDKKDNNKIKFEAKTLKSSIPVTKENIKISNYENKEQKYWAKLKIEKKEIRQETDKKKITQNKNQIILFGEVKNNVFKSHIYECKTDKPDGKYWTLINVDFDKVEYFKIKNDKPEIAENQTIIIGHINDNIFHSEVNFNHLVEIDENNEDGKYWAVFEINKEPYDFQIIKNEMPKAENNETIIEGIINQNDKTGNIEFLPSKSRDDHRHHAIDALTVALTELSFLNKLSHWNANLKDKQRGIAKEHLSFDMPWDNFFQNSKKSINEIIISHRFDNKVMTKITKTIKKKDKKFKSVGMSVRGQLHKEFVYGARKRALKGEDGKILFDENSKIKVEKDNNGDIVYYYHIRKKLEDIKSKTHVKKIVDDEIRKLIEKRINYIGGYSGNKNDKVPNETFFKTIDDNKVPQILLPNRKGGEKIPVKKVRIKEIIGNAVKLKEINQWVNPRNNHHIAIYENKGGELFEKVITLWEAVERKKQGLPVIDKNPTDGSKFIQSLEKNEMFILDLSDEKFKDNKNNTQLLGEHLYKVQKIAGGDYFFEICFRYHLDSRADKNAKNDYKYIKGFGDGKTGWKTFNPLKVKIDILGKFDLV